MRTMPRAGWTAAAALLLAGPLAGQCNNVTTVPPGSITSGTACYSNNTTLTAGGVQISGTASVSFIAGQSIQLGNGFRATAGSAETFHAWVQGLPAAVSFLPSVGSGQVGQFTWTASSPSGYGALAEVYALFSETGSGSNACYLRYASNLLYLADNAASTWGSGVAPQGVGTLSNSQCSVSASTFTKSESGNQLTLSAQVTFQSTFAGSKTEYLMAQDREALNSGWQAMGTWTVGGGTPLAITTTSPLAPGVAGTAYSTSLAASGGSPGYAFSLASGALPGGLTMSNAGIISGTPAGAGSSEFMVRVTDGLGATATKAFSISVGGSLTIRTPSTLPTGMVGAVYSTTLEASGGTPAYSWAVTGGALPGGLSLSSTGTISGTPTGGGAMSFTVRVTDTQSAASVKEFSLTIQGTGLAIVTTSPLSAGIAGTPYSATLAASGGTPVYTWSLAGGTLPGGLSLSTGGVISGTPTGTGTSTFTARVTDSASATSAKEFALSIGSALSITTTALPSVMAGASYNTTLAASGGTPGYTWSLASGSLPGGMSLSLNGTISGAPGGPGNFSFTVRVTDSDSATATRALAILVGAPALVITTASALPGGTTGVAYSATLTATGGAPGYEWSLAGGALPAGLVLSAGGVVSGTPSATGSSAFTARVTDSALATTTLPLTLRIAASGAAQEPSREYIGLGGRVLAIESAATSLSLVCGAASTGAVGVPFNSGAPTVTGGSPPYTYSVASGTLLALSLNTSTGVVTGIPTAAGNFSIQVRDANNAAAGSTCPFTMASPALNITTTALPGGQVGLSYSTALAASGGTGSYTWALVSGALPGGLNLSTNSISGTPTTTGTFTFTVRVTDSASSTDTQQLSIFVGAAYANLYMNSSTFHVGDQFTLWLNTNIPNTSFSMCWRHNGVDLPCGTDFDTTDASGHWAHPPASFLPGSEGSWEEWVVFPGGLTSTHVYFEVTPAPSATLYIYPSSFQVGDSFSLWLETNIPNASFSMCWRHNGVDLGCESFGTTDANGYWGHPPATFPAGSEGSWEEWVVFQGVATSNRIYFVVN